MQKLSLFERLHFLHRRFRYAHRSEPDTIRFIQEFVRRGDRVIDIGANKGIVTWFLAHSTGPEGEVLAFEPQPELIPVLGAVMTTFGLGQVNIIDKGLSDAPGILPLYREYAGSTGTMVGATSHTTESIPVEVVTLDQFLREREGERERPRISLIKCDVDGFEKQVLRGATQTLRSDAPALLIEIGEPDIPDMAEFLAKHGYRDFWFYFRHKLYAGDMTERVAYQHDNARYRNFLFLHEQDPRKATLERFTRPS